MKIVVMVVEDEDVNVRKLSRKCLLMIEYHFIVILTICFYLRCIIFFI